MAEHFDVVIVGAGLSGIGAAVHLQTDAPRKSFVILEGRESIGGTWDLFRYPGIRSDSDMYTLGYSFRPWRDAKAIADGASILEYVRDTARQHDIEGHIRFGHRAARAQWSSSDARWTVATRRGADDVVFTCDFLLLCSGYYRYDAGHAPDFPGSETFDGRVVHPQHWSADVDYVGKNVVVIGSGATAVTLVPEIAKQAAHVTMLQRSPTYMVSRPSEDSIANWLRRKLPAKLAYRLTRAKNVGLGMFFYNLARKRPERVKRLLLGGIKQAMGDDYDVGPHFTPRYNPWDQRLCLVPDGDMFAALRKGEASIETGEIERFVPEGIRLRTGKVLPADLIVTATGLHLQLLGGMQIEVDGASVEPSQVMQYKGMMFSDVPNLAAVMGYTNASWTLKADLTCQYVCRLLNYMDARGWKQCTPKRDPAVAEEPLMNFTSGYIQRAAALLPKQGSRRPWKLHQNYVRDTMMLRYGRVNDGTMVFSKPAKVAQAA